MNYSGDLKNAFQFWNKEWVSSQILTLPAAPASGVNTHKNVTNNNPDKSFLVATDPPSSKCRAQSMPLWQQGDILSRRDFHDQSMIMRFFTGIARAGLFDNAAPQGCRDCRGLGVDMEFVVNAADVVANRVHADVQLGSRRLIAVDLGQ
jgi:hypothetical protein